MPHEVKKSARCKANCVSTYRGEQHKAPADFILPEWSLSTAMSFLSQAKPETLNFEMLIPNSDV